MSDPYREIELGILGVDYVRKCLELGNTLSKLILQIHELGRGRVVTKLPSDVDDNAASDFQTGGKFGGVSRTYAKLQSVPNTDSLLVDEIRSFLNERETRICIFEDASASPADSFLKSLHTSYSTFGNEVYHLLCHDYNSDDLILKTVREARSWRLMGAMTSASDAVALCSEQSTLNTEVFQQLAERMEKIIIGAYDGEGYVVWAKC